MTNRKKIDPRSTMRTLHHLTPALTIKSTTRYLAATALSTLTVGVEKAMTTKPIINPAGRNIVLTLVDANNNSVSAFIARGLDQFGRPITERLPASGSQTGAGSIVGTKIFGRLEGITPVTLTVGDAGIDTVSVGDGDKCGLPFMLSADCHEIQQAQLENGTTVTAITPLDSTRFDTTNHAVLAAAFSGSAIASGDRVGISYIVDEKSTDNLDYPAR